MSEIIRQGEWGIGDLTGAHKEVEEGYVKFLKKFGLQREGFGRGRGTGETFIYGDRGRKKQDEYLGDDPVDSCVVNDDPDGIANDSTNSDL